MASLGNAADFGDLGASVIGSAGYGNNTKAFLQEVQLMVLGALILIVLIP